MNINIHRASMTGDYENSKPYIEAAIDSSESEPAASAFSKGSLLSVIDESAGKVTVKMNGGSSWVTMTVFEG